MPFIWIIAFAVAFIRYLQATIVGFYWYFVGVFCRYRKSTTASTMIIRHDINLYLKYLDSQYNKSSEWSTNIADVTIAARMGIILEVLNVNMARSIIIEIYCWHQCPLPHCTLAQSMVICHGLHAMF